MDKYDYIVINDQVEDCADRIHAIVQAKDCLLGNNLKFIEETKKELEQLQEELLCYIHRTQTL